MSHARFAVVPALVSLAGCEGEPGSGKVIDALIYTQQELHRAIETDPDAWTTTLTEGIDIVGSLPGASGGTVEVSGWRFGREEQAGSGYHSVYGEKLFLTFNAYSALDLTLSGPVVITAHSLDFANSNAASIEDASRATGYVGVLSVSGAESGTFQVDVNGFTANRIQWTCGTINGDAYGHGPCF